ncbi:MAG: ABC-F family ATP-binding cassette domain-containing protein [Actinobacteria bacterium]|nr:ABC-F family ATP-binding cassette domain-containing protein [Actinomycetota bacterium]
MNLHGGIPPRRWEPTLLARPETGFSSYRQARAVLEVPRLDREGPAAVAENRFTEAMSVLVATGLRKELSGTPLFDGVSFTLRRRDRLALAGPNGAGKTTLLRCLVGETSITGGEIAFGKSVRVALHDQRPPRDRGLSLREYALSGAGDLVAVEEELRRLETAMAEGAHDPATLRRYAEAQARLEHAGGWDWRDRAASVLRGLGFTDADLDRPLDTFSGGELTRASLARALSADPDLLLLDEPTNHLDVESLEWLERTLVDLDAAVILVAHDRWFLEAVTTAVLELGGPKPYFFAGPWHAWRREKAARASAAATQLERVGDDIERLERFVARFRYKKSKAKQAQAKLSQIARLDRERKDAAAELEALTRRRRTLGFEFFKPARSGRIVLEAENLSLSAGEKRLLTGATLVLERGEHVALVGPNGSGKTTLLTTLIGDRAPDAGVVRLGHGVVPAYFSQHDAELPKTGTILEAAMRATGLSRPQAQSLLGRFLFSGWEVHEKQVSVLSGGERRRLALALVVASGANLLVLDEPTNHLDLESREALEAALEAFPGTVLLVSHDRAILDAVPDRIVAVEGQTLRSYDGGWADLVRERSEQPQPAAAAAPPPSPPKPHREKQTAGRRGPTELERVERRIEQIEKHLTGVEERLAADWSNMDLLTAHRAARNELQKQLTRWEALFEAAEAAR